MRGFLFYAFGAVLFICFCGVGFCQETIQITTYYPAPFGVYRDLQVTGNFQTNFLAASFQMGPTVYWDDFITVETAYGDVIGIGGDAVDAEAEIRVQTTVPAREVVAFRDPLGNLINIRALNVGSAVLVPYSNTAPVDCPPSLHVVAVLDNNRRGASMASPPMIGYMICH